MPAVKQYGWTLEFESEDFRGGIHIINYSGSPSVKNPGANNIEIGQHILAQVLIFLPQYTERFSSNFELFLYMLSVHIFFILRLTDMVVACYFTILSWIYSLQIILGKYLDVD